MDNGVPCQLAFKMIIVNIGMNDFEYHSNSSSAYLLAIQEMNAKSKQLAVQI